MSWNFDGPPMFGVSNESLYETELHPRRKRMTTAKKAERLANNAAETYDSPDYNENAVVNLMLRELPLVALLELAEAAKLIYEETADYIRVNNLGDTHHNLAMQMLRDKITALKNHPSMKAL